MKKKFMLVIIVIAVTIVHGSADTNIRNIDTILSDIYQEQNVQNKDQVNPDKISPLLLAELGDAVMEKMIGNHERHEQMDELMGGEGSQNLTAMHRRLGYQYLSGNIINYSDMMHYYGMINEYPAKTTNNFKRGSNMMWNNGYEMMNGYVWYGILFSLIILILIVFAIIFITRLLFKRQSIKLKDDSPIKILNKRYAMGEISKKEYELIKREIDH